MNKHRNEILTKLETIIKDENIPLVYKAWLNQVVDYIHDEERNESGDWVFMSNDHKFQCVVAGYMPYRTARKEANRLFSLEERRKNGE